MKKTKFISKLLVLAMIAAMLPVFALTANAVDDNPYGHDPDTTVVETVETPSTTNSEGTAQAEVTETQMAEAVSNAVMEALSEGKDAAVVINVETSADAKGLEVSLPAASLAELAKEEGSLTISSGVADITADSTALNELVGQAGGDQISFEVAPVEEVPAAQKAVLDSYGTSNANTEVFDLSMMSGSTPIHNFGSGKLEVALPYTGTSANPQVYCVNDRGMIESFDTTLNNGKVRFSTGHLSTYVVSDRALYTAKTFTDVVKSDWSSHYVNWAADNGVTVGNDDGTFGRTVICNRADFVTFLYRAAGSPAVTGVTNPFTDVKTSDYYYNAVMWAVKNGITKGTNEAGTIFDPDAPVLRGQAVTFMNRYAKDAGIATKTGTESFTDVTNAGEVAYYYDAIGWAQANGISVGNGDGTFSPLSGCERQEMVTFLYRLFMANA